MSQNRAQKLLAYLGDVAVNGSSIKGQMGEPGLKTEAIIPSIKDTADPNKVIDTSEPCQRGWRNIIVKEGPEAFAKAIRAYKGCVSLIAARVTGSETLSSSSWTRRGGMLTNPCSLLVCEPSIWPISPRRLVTLCRMPTLWSAGVALRSMSQCDFYMRTHGTGW